MDEVCKKFFHYIIDGKTKELLYYKNRKNLLFPTGFIS